MPKSKNINFNNIEFLSTQLMDNMHRVNHTFIKGTARHLQEVVTFTRDKEYSFTVDKKIAPLIKELWNNGFTTYNSCSGGAKSVPYVHMAMPYSYQNYLLAIEIVRKFWSNKYIEVRMDPLNFAVGFYAYTSFDDCDNLDYTFEPYNQEEKEK